MIGWMTDLLSNFINRGNILYPYHKKPSTSLVDETSEIHKAISKAMAQSMAATKENAIFNVLNQSIGVSAMSDRPLFQMFQAKNGFYARMPNGEIVLGMTMTEACEAACAAATEEAISAEPSPSRISDPLGQGLDPDFADNWEKVKRIKLREYQTQLEIYKAQMGVYNAKVEKLWTFL
jgi:hypothetical protein